MEEFSCEVVAPLARGQRLTPYTRAIWCHRITMSPYRRRCLELVTGPLRDHRPWRGKHHGAMWEHLHRCERHWAVTHAELMRLWYHHKGDIPARLWWASRSMQEELLTGQILRLPQLCGSRSRRSQLPAELWCCVASWVVDSVKSAFAWRHVCCGAWGEGLTLLLRMRWPHLPRLSTLLPWLQAWTFEVQRRSGPHAAMQPYVEPLSAEGHKRKRLHLQWVGGEILDACSGSSLEGLGVPWTVRCIWCDFTCL